MHETKMPFICDVRVYVSRAFQWIEMVSRYIKLELLSFQDLWSLIHMFQYVTWTFHDHSIVWSKAYQV